MIDHVVRRQREPELLYDAATIARRTAELGAQITRDHAGRDLIAVCVLKGAFVFFADLVRQIDLALTCDFIGISSYAGAQKSSGVVELTRDLGCSIEGKDVLIVEDIIDSGLTMQYLLENFQTRRPARVRVCTLLYKPSDARAERAIDYVGFEAPAAFVVGYGLDHAERYRNLPFIGVYRDTGEGKS